MLIVGIAPAEREDDMKQFKIYEVYMDDGRDCFKVTVPAQTKQGAIDYVNGNGEIIAIRESESLKDIDVDCLTDTLLKTGWGRSEIDVITSLISICGLRRL